MSSPRILVTGGNGFIGKHCCSELAKRGLTPISLGIGEKSEFVSKDNESWQHINLDLNDSEKITNLLADLKPTHVLHLAWFVNHGDYWESLRNLDSLAMTVKLFREFVHCGGVRFLATGTCAEYDWKIAGPYQESSILNPHSFYGKVKQETHELLKFLSHRNSVSFAWARLYYLFGPGEPPNKLIPSLLRNLERNEPLQFGNDPTKKDFIYVKDVATALVTVLLSDYLGPVNIGTGIGYSVKEVVSSLLAQTGDSQDLSVRSIATNDIGHGAILADTTILNGLGFRPRFNLDHALKDYLENKT